MTAARWPNHDLRNSMRDKENIPFSPHQQYSPSPSPSPIYATDSARNVRPSLARTPGSQPRFTTDSFLGNDSTQSSLSQIPSPSHPNSNGAAGTVAQRRRIPVRKMGSDGLPRSRHKPNRSELPTQPDNARKPRPRPATRHLSLDQTNGLSTPPRSRHGSFSSPNDIMSSPPPALTDTYLRIDQEEDLAQTEGEISDPDQDANREHDYDLVHDHVQMRSQPQPQLSVAAFSNLSKSKPASTETLQRFVHSRGATPPLQRPRSEIPAELTVQSVMSDQTGMSFANEITDPNLRGVLTPHYEQKRASRQAFPRAASFKKLAAFSKANQIRLESDQLANHILLEPHQVADAVSPTPRLLPERQAAVAFTKANRIKLPSDRLLPSSHQRSHSDHNIDVAQVDAPLDLHKDWRAEDLSNQAVPQNHRIHRQPFFAKTYGFPERGITHDNAAGNFISAGTALNAPRNARSESPLAAPTQPMNPVQSTETGANDRAQSNGPPLPNNRWFSPVHRQVDNTASSTATSDIWANPDIPIKSVEANPTDMSLKSGPVSELQSSPEKSRAFNYELTGHSFQVSDSPPVRVSNAATDYLRQKEIQGLAQQGVTTNRLNQLRFRESQEKLRLQARSPLSEMSESINGDVVSDLPALQRSISNGSRGSGYGRASLDRTRSHDDILQRLARGSSATPRSGSVSDKGRKASIPTEEDPVQDTSKNGGDDKVEPVVPGNAPTVKRGSNLVEATPKVTGAWTDTILPDTVKTTRRPNKTMPYAHTPHVNAGGWVDTPAPPATNKLDSVAESTQEADVPEELMQGIVKDSASDKTIVDTKSAQAPTRKICKKGVVGEYLDEKKQQQQQNQPHNNPTDDTINPGETTMHSLQDLMAMDDTQLSQLSHVTITGQSDTQMLGLLASRLGRLSGTIHEAHAGVDRLQTLVDQSTVHSDVKSSPTSIQPITSWTSSFIPPLARSRPGSRIPRPTRLGWVLIAFLVWYIVECTLAEIYSHPVYAEQYTWPTEPEPDFPVVLPTMLYRWFHLRSLPDLTSPLRSLFQALVRIIGIWLGWTDGFVHVPTTNTPAPVAGAGAEAEAAYALDFDEYL